MNYNQLDCITTFNGLVDNTKFVIFVKEIQRKLNSFIKIKIENYE